MSRDLPAAVEQRDPRYDKARAVLMKCTGYDPRTPKPSRVVMEAWQEHFDIWPKLTVEDLLAGVKRYYRDHGGEDRPALPRDISAAARAVRGEAFARGEGRDEFEALCDSKAEPDPEERAALPPGHPDHACLPPAGVPSAAEEAEIIRRGSIRSFADRFGIGEREAEVRMRPERRQANELDALAVKAQHQRMAGPPRISDGPPMVIGEDVRLGGRYNGTTGQTTYPGCASCGEDILDTDRTRMAEGGLIHATCPPPSRGKLVPGCFYCEAKITWTPEVKWQHVEPTDCDWGKPYSRESSGVHLRRNPTPCGRDLMGDDGRFAVHSSAMMQQVDCTACIDAVKAAPEKFPEEALRLGIEWRKPWPSSAEIGISEDPIPQRSPEPPLADLVAEAERGYPVEKIKPLSGRPRFDSADGRRIEEDREG